MIENHKPQPEKEKTAGYINQFENLGSSIASSGSSELFKPLTITSHYSCVSANSYHIKSSIQ